MISFNEATKAASRGHFSKTVSVEPDIFPIALLQSIQSCVGHWPQTTSSSINFKSGFPENLKKILCRSLKKVGQNAEINSTSLDEFYTSSHVLFLMKQDNGGRVIDVSEGPFTFS